MIRRIELAVKVLTPLHIGTGTVLTEGFDYVCHNGNTYRLDLDALAEELYTRDPKLTETLLRTPPGQLLKPEDLCPDAPYVRYVLSGEPSGREFREAIKDPHDRPYIPGSSLKGALRTVIAWHAWKELGLSLSRIRLGSKPKNAAEDLEAEIFGRDPEKGKKSPHHDLMRALRISDSKPANISVLKIYPVKVWTRRNGGVPISVEAIKPGTEFVLEAVVDEHLFSEWASKAKGFPMPHREWIHRLPELARKRAEVRAQLELAFWPPGTEPHNFYTKLFESARKAVKGFLIQLGFGTGWEGTTIGAPLKSDPMWPKVYTKYPMGLEPRTKRKTPAKEFPRSRRVTVKPDGSPDLPLGWVWISWEEV